MNQRIVIGRSNNEVFLNVGERGHFVADDQKMNDFFQTKKIILFLKNLLVINLLLKKIWCNFKGKIFCCTLYIFLERFFA